MLVVFGLAAVSALAARRHLEDGRAALVRGRTALLDDDATTASAEFRDARLAFVSAVDDAGSPWMRLAGIVPIAGRTPDAIRAIAEAGEATAHAAVGLATAIDELPGGLASLAPTPAGVPLEPLAGLADELQRADALTAGALEDLRASPDFLVAAPVAEARAEAVDALERLSEQLHAGALILRGLPGFLGADGPRRYFFGASNPAELRGTGGLIGAYSILTTEQGRLRFSDFRPVQSLPRLDVGDVPSPSEEYSRNFDFYRRRAGFWLNVNMTPDFPLAAEAIALTYQETTGEQLDGVIVADPFALQELMRVTGPIAVQGSRLQVAPGEIVGFITNEAYALFDTNAQRKLVLGAAATAVFRAFLAQEGATTERLEALSRAFDDGHVKVWSADPGLQEGLELTSAGGAFAPEGTDLLSVVTNSASGTKLDFYQKRSLVYDVELGPLGSAEATVEVGLENLSPTSGLPRYVIGPYKTYSTQPGENVAVVHLFCDAECVLRRITRAGDPIRVGAYEHEGYPFFEDYARTPSGATARIGADLFLPAAWAGDDGGGTYLLSFRNQTTIRPTRVTVSIRVPEGMEVTSASDLLRPEGDRLVYEGSPRGDLELEVSFAPPLPVRIWRALTDLLP